ncbi:MAG: hypothetical protein ABI467_07915 [Kofleriaceae bacterium]
MAVTRATLRRYAPAIGIAALALVIAWGFAAMTLHFTRPMGLPLDDSYIYLTYAKQFGRGQPFTYFPGGGYSAGSTSVLWPMVLAPFWTLGARGHALVWVSFGMCGALFALVGLGCYRFVAKLAGSEVTGVVAAVLVLVIGPFAWSALAGMEVAFASALLVATLLLLARQPAEGPPGWKLAVVLAATSLSRPEATLIVGAIIAACAVQRLRRHAWRDAARWVVPLAAPLAWVIANRVLAGQLFPNTGVVKSHFYLPGFDLTYWRETVPAQAGQMLKALFWSPGSPLVWPRLVALAFVIGAVRIVLWARREQRWLVAIVAIAAPLALMFAVVGTSGVGGWSFQNLRYVATAFPLVMLVCAVALAPPRALDRPLHRRAWAAGSGVVAVAFAASAWSGLRDNMLLFAQGAMDTNSQVVTIGHFIHDKLPGASILFHDAGAIAYYGDSRVYDMLGLVTDHQAEVANNGPGARFEFLEHLADLPAGQRPTHFAYYPGWLGTAEFFGDVLLHTSLRPGLPTRRGRLVGEADMQVIVANWDHAHTGERPINDHTGWKLVDRVDIADLASEHAHHWRGAMGRRRFGDPTARWSIVETETAGAGLVIDGGRTIREHDGEHFTVELDPQKPTRVVIRTGGKRAYPFHETIATPITLKLFTGTQELGHMTIAPPVGQFSELAFNLPPRVFRRHPVELRTEASGPYRVFHWFVLQPE